MNNDPLLFAIRLPIDRKTLNSRLISQYIMSDVRDAEADRLESISNVMNTDLSRCKTC